MTICIDCLRKYQEKRYELYGRPKGVCAITARARVEEMIMTTLRMILMKKTEEKEKEKHGYIMMIIHTTDGDVTIDASDYNDNLFYDAIALTYDRSPMLRQYFHNDRSRTRPDNKSL